MKKVILKDLNTNDSYLWRYVDIHKLISFLATQSVVFSRMDKFSDKLEGITANHISTSYMLENAPDPIYDFKLPMSNPHRDDLSATLLKEINKKRQYQENTFVSCWYLNKRESTAMWNLYSNRDSVALKINYDKLVKALIENIDLTSRQHIHIKKFIAGKVKYKDILNHNPLTAVFDKAFGKKGGITVKYKSLRKDESYKHENEYRFCIETSGYNYDTPISIKINSINDLGITIVFHPYMEEWKKKNIRALAEKFEFACTFSNSEMAKWIQ